jgi:two-component system, chemotaxis family, sensor kinase Cph1
VTARSEPAAFVAPGTRIDLTNCDREPIHVIGHVQPFAAVLALHGPTLQVRQASANAAEVLGRPGDAVVGARLDALLGEGQAARVGELARVVAADAMARGELTSTLTSTGARRVSRPLRLHVGGGVARVPVHGVVHAGEGGGCLLELEPSLESEPMAVDEFAELVRQTVARIEGASTVRDAAGAVADEVRGLTGYDRVWVYKFHEDWHGEIVAESRAPSVEESWLGMHYPASDIPAQARALFLRQRIRLIADARYAPVPLEPAFDPVTEAPLDLSDCVSRGVSSMHVRYLENMGVRASMSISLVRDGALWGLVSCHHYDGPRRVAHDRRAACELLAQAFAARLATAESVESSARMLAVRDVQVRLVDRLAREDDLVAALVGGDPSLLDLVHADGAAVCLRGGLTTAGRAPAPASIGELLARLEGMDGDVVHTDSLGKVFAPATEWADVASGMLAVSLGARRDWLVWFRGEQRQVIAWGGDPRKPVEVDAAGQTRVLGPRDSFERWEQEVRGRAVPWDRAEVDAARALRGTLVDLLLARAAQVEALNRELARSNDELDAFTYIASHDLKEPLRGIHNFAAIVREDVGDALSADAAAKLETIERLSRRLDAMVDALFHFSRVGRMELDTRDVPMQEVLDDALERLVAAPGRDRVTVRVPRALPVVHADRDRLAEVLFNLLSNAMKYSREDGGIVEVGHVAPGEPLPAWAPEGVAGTIHYVRDDGIGIDPRHHDTVWRLYKRLHARDAFGGGSGAGLTIVRRIIERHGGRVGIDSRLGGGTTVWFTLGDDRPS